MSVESTHACHRSSLTLFSDTAVGVAVVFRVSCSTPFVDDELGVGAPVSAIANFALTIWCLFELFHTVCRDPGVIPRMDRVTRRKLGFMQRRHPPDLQVCVRVCVIVVALFGLPLGVCFATLKLTVTDRRFVRREQVFHASGRRIPIHHCSICEVFTPPRTAHCPVCNNCVQNFDVRS